MKIFRTLTLVRLLGSAIAPSILTYAAWDSQFAIAKIHAPDNHPPNN